MIMTKEMLSAGQCLQKDLWATPDHVFNKLDSIYRFDTDPCCLPDTATCKDFWTPTENGLIQDWGGRRLYVNPPYSRGNIDKWAEKCAKEAVNSLVVALLPVSTSSDWFKHYVLGNSLYWVNKRIRFKGAEYTAPFSSLVVVFNKGNRNYSIDFR